MEKIQLGGGRDDIAQRVALGATGVALAAGAVAARAVLASRKTRAGLKRRAVSTFKRLGAVL